MDKRVIAGVFALIIALSIFAWSFFLYQSDISSVNTLTAKGFESLIQKATGLWFILFCIFFPLTIAIITILPHFFGRELSYPSAIGGALLGLAGEIAFLGFSPSGFLVAIFFLPGIVALLELSYLRKEEFKKLVTFRTTAAASKAFFIILALGIGISTGLTAIENNEKNVKEFGDSVIELAIKPSAAGQGGLTEKLADTIIESQKQTMNAITQTPQFSALRGKSDTDVQVFVLTMEAVQQNLASPETRQKLVSEMNKQADTAQQVITFEMLRKQSPMLDKIAEYHWALLAVSTAMLFLFVSNLLLANIAGAMAAILRATIEAAEQALGNAGVAGSQ